MTLSFRIEYRTQWGESLRIYLTYTATSGHRATVELDMTTADGAVWTATLQLPSHALHAEYRYHIIYDARTRRSEWERIPHKITLPPTSDTITCHDRWRDMPADAYRYSKTFTAVFHPRPTGLWPYAPEDRTILIHVFASQLPCGCVPAVSGSIPALGTWQAGHERRLTEISPNEWAFALPATEIHDTFEYKFLALDETTGERRAWEQRDNRHLTPPHLQPSTSLHIQDDDIIIPHTLWRAAGCVIPLFSIRSNGGCGIGDFGDIKTIARWLATTGQRILQLLPINDTTATGTKRDSYPYNCISAHALHPIYADLRQLPKLNDSEQQRRFDTIRRELNGLAQVDYVRVHRTKLKYLRALFDQIGEKTLQSHSFASFLSSRRDWLIPYTAYCYLRDKYKTPDFSHWDSMTVYDHSQILSLIKQDKSCARAVAFHAFVQYILHKQLLAASKQAHRLGIALKADIPIGVSPLSAEAWVSPHLFNRDMQAGAPPDDFSADGQNWGFPTYNWPNMMADDCHWWHSRLATLAQYFDAFRIDHVLGFFRIWEIPSHATSGLLGHFSPALPLSPQDIEAYGLKWRGDTYTKPLITDSVLHRLFGERTAEARHNFLASDGQGHYELKPAYATQRQIIAAFASKPHDKLRNLLCHLVANVLFLPDKNDPNAFHPRIQAQKTLAYDHLAPHEKDTFNRLYDDYFYHRHNSFWHGGATGKLRSLISHTAMLPCAEDLGMVPACVPPVLNNLGILSLEVQTMPKTPNRSFANLAENPYRSVDTISTHDMPTLRGWWEENPETARRFCRDALALDPKAPVPHSLPGWLAERILKAHLASPSMLCIISFQDWMSIDEALRLPHPRAERINVPANPDHYWRYRMHIPAERLLNATTLNEKIRKLIQTCGR